MISNWLMREIRSGEIFMELKKGQQIIKTRDDYVPVLIEGDPKKSDPKKPFVLSEDTECPWIRDNKPFGPEKLRPRVEPWLTALAQSEHLSLLIGSGLTHAIHGIAANAKLPGMDPTGFGVFDDEIAVEAKRVAKVARRQNGNFEDQIRVANELLRGLEIIPKSELNGIDADSQVAALRKALKNALKLFAVAILEAERNLASATGKEREKAFNYLVDFLMSFASRSGTRERLNIYTTNYDRYIEAGADAAGLRLIDRFVGTLAPVFRASRLDIDLHYNPPGIRGEPRYLEGVARFTKLHGSIDWVDFNGAIRRIALPFGAVDISPFLSSYGLAAVDDPQLMIYPNAAKDRETSFYPYVELFRDLATTICRPNSTLVCYGYSFGDEHINRVIADMLTIPSTHLVIISHSDPLGRIRATYDTLGRSAQVTLLVGDHLGDLRTLVDKYLPKSAIDRNTIRMADILKARMNKSQDDDSSNSDGVSNRSNTES